MLPRDMMRADCRDDEPDRSTSHAGRRGCEPRAARRLPSARRQRRAHPVPDRMVRAGRARRLLPGTRRRTLRPRRAGRRNRDGRAADQWPAAAHRRPGGHHHGVRHPGAQGDRAGPARGDRRQLVPARPAGPDEPQERRLARAAQGAQAADRQHRPRHVLAVAGAEVRLPRRRRRAVHLQPAAVPRRSERGGAGLCVVRAVRRRASRDADQLLPVRRPGLSALRIDDRHHARVHPAPAGGGGGVRARFDARLA